MYIISRQNRKKAVSIFYGKDSLINSSFLKSFLRDIKKQIVKGNLNLAERQKNMDFVRDKGLMIPDDIKDIILSLTPKNYVGGPEDDRDGYPGYVYKFKTDAIDEVITYIKIRYNPPDEVVCISFHEDE